MTQITATYIDHTWQRAGAPRRMFYSFRPYIYSVYPTLPSAARQRNILIRYFAG